MGVKAALSKPYAKYIASTIRKWSAHPIAAQDAVFNELIRGGRGTAFGQDHRFAEIKDYDQFKSAVPIRDYEGLKPYIDRVVAGEEGVLWPGVPIYLSKTSGTTSGAKYIPITNESMPNHIDTARNALLSYIAETGNASFVDGKMIFLQGSPELDKSGSVPVGRLSGIVANHVPSYLLKNRLPSMETNCIDDWESKVDAIVEETKDQDMRLISGIPSWVQMYFERLLKRTGKATVKEVFPNFSLFVFGGVSYEPYRELFKTLIGDDVPSIELYPASEGFIAFQDSQEQDGLLLVLNKGIFYEFIPADEYFDDEPTRLSLKDVELGKNYAVILNTNAGLWGYDIGDTVRFTSLDPYRVVVTGRIKHFISAFGEHVIAEEVESVMQEAMTKHGVSVSEFHVAPQVTPKDGLPYHEWFVCFEKAPADLGEFASDLDAGLRRKNTYYNDLLTGNVLRPAIITPLQSDAFVNYMRSIGKLGGQNKVQRLANDRQVADQLAKFASDE